MAPSHFLYYTTHIDNVASSSPNELQLYLAFYGIDSYQNNVDSAIYNLLPFKIVNGKIQFQEDIDMNNKSTINITDGIDKMGNR